MAYVFNADVYCDACGASIREALRAEGREPEQPEASDSDAWPQSYAEEFAETDSPQHCGECGEYLAQPLTSEGVAYVAEAARAYVRGEHAGSAALAEWCADVDANYSPRGMLGAWIGAAEEMLSAEHRAPVRRPMLRGNPAEHARLARAQARRRARYEARSAAIRNGAYSAASALASLAGGSRE